MRRCFRLKLTFPSTYGESTRILRELEITRVIAFFVYLSQWLRVENTAERKHHGSIRAYTDRS